MDNLNKNIKIGTVKDYDHFIFTNNSIAAGSVVSTFTVELEDQTEIKIQLKESIDKDKGNNLKGKKVIFDISKSKVNKLIPDLFTDAEIVSVEEEE